MLYHTNFEPFIQSWTETTSRTWDWGNCDWSCGSYAAPPEPDIQEIKIFFDKVFHPTLGTKKSDIVDLPNYPPCDCWVSEDLKTLHYQFALAGFSKEEVSLTAIKNQLHLSAANLEEDDRKLLHKGISRKAIELVISIDKDYAPTKAKSEFSDGLLIVEIPRSDKSKVIKLL